MPEFNPPRRYSLPIEALEGYDGDIWILRDPYFEDGAVPWSIRRTLDYTINLCRSIEPDAPVLTLAASGLTMVGAAPDETLRSPKDRAIRDAMLAFTRSHNFLSWEPWRTFNGVIGLDGVWRVEDIQITDSRGAGISLSLGEIERLAAQFALDLVPVLYRGPVNEEAADIINENPGRYIIRANGVDARFGRYRQWLLETRADLAEPLVAAGIGGFGPDDAVLLSEQDWQKRRDKQARYRHQRGG